ncbi:MAG: hypothetical protein Q8L57_01890, partial [bacterium]|nr:hypothetical protein [bacterium]
MKFSYNWLQDYLAKKLSPEKMADILTMRSFETTANRLPTTDYDQKAERAVDRSRSTVDWILDIDILPNRAHDCFSHLGVSREISAITGIKLKLPQTSKPAFKSGEKIGRYLKIEVKNSEFCPRYTARMIKGVKVGPSPKWLQERLLAV